MHPALAEIRKFSNVPVIILSGRGDDVSRIKGLEMGADDYIVKPFSHTELLARDGLYAELYRTQFDDGPGITGNNIFLAARTAYEAIESVVFRFCVRNDERVQTDAVLQKVF